MSDAGDPGDLAVGGDSASSSITAGTVEGEQRLIGASSPQELRAATAARKHQLDSARLAHELAETAKANTQRRRLEMIIAIVVIGITVVAFLGGLLLTTFAEDVTSRQFGQEIVKVIIGTVAGGIAGYFGGRAAR